MSSYGQSSLTISRKLVIILNIKLLGLSNTNSTHVLVTGGSFAAQHLRGVSNRTILLGISAQTLFAKCIKCANKSANHKSGRLYH